MKKHLHKIGLTLFLLVSISAGNLYSQCTNAIFGQYPSGTFFPIACGVTQTLTTCAYASEYTVVSLTAGSSYTFSTSVPTDVITITDDATNTAQVFGTGSVVFNCTITGLYRFNRHLVGCGSQATCRNAYMVLGPPAYDNCSGAIAITPGVVSGSTVSCISVDAGVPLCGTASVPTAPGLWYSYTPACSGTITAGLCTNTFFDSQLSVFSGTCGALVCVSGNNDFCITQSQATWAGSAGTTYYILVHAVGLATGTFDLTLSQQDLTAPVANVPVLPAINSACSVNLTAPTASDNCAGTIVGTTPIMTFSANGTYNITWTYNDGNGNSSTQGQTINISDLVPPTIGGPSDTTLSNNAGICGAVVDYITPSCVTPVTYYDQADDVPNDNGYFNESSLGQWMADDFIVPALATWNIETFSATLWEQPVGAMTNITVNIHADAGGVPGAILSTQVLTSADWVAGPYLGTAFGYDITSYDFTLPTPVTGLTGGAGGTTYWLSFYDNFSFFSVAWEITNTITGNPAKFSTTSETGPWNTTGPAADLVFTLGGSVVGSVSDNCPTCATVAQTAGLASGSVFPTGTTTNTFVATDAAGNTASYSFDVIVNDTEAPVPLLDSAIAYTFTSTDLPILCPDLATTLDSVQVTVIPTTLNSGDIASVCLDIDHTFDSDMTISLISPQGTVLILSDANGAAGDDYIQTCFDMNAPTNINSGSAPFIGSYIPEGAGGFDVFNGENPNGYWKLSIFDAFNGDQGVLYDFHINFDFHYDTILPVVHTGCSSLVAPMAVDNCDDTLSATTTDPTSYTADGTYLVTWTYTDGDGNASVQTQQIIVDDATAPVPDVSSLPIVSGSCSVTVEIIPTATDGCAGIIDGTTINSLTYNTAGTYTVTWTYDDGNGNIVTQNQTVVVTDNAHPVPTQPILPNVIGNCSVTVSPAPTANDNCAGVVTGTTMDPTTYNVIGTFFITWTYDDGNGNIWTQNQTVVVNPCLGLEDESGQWNALIYPNPSSGIFTLSLSQEPGANTQVRLVDALGQVLYSEMLQGQIQQFDFSHLASATYYLLITNDNGQISKPVIIRHDY